MASNLQIPNNLEDIVILKRFINELVVKLNTMTSNTTQSGITSLSTTISTDPTQEEVQELYNKVNEIISALKASNIIA